MDKPSVSGVAWVMQLSICAAEINSHVGTILVVLKADCDPYWISLRAVVQIFQQETTGYASEEECCQVRQCFIEAIELARK
jgi:hypothetical protein